MRAAASGSPPDLIRRATIARLERRADFLRAAKGRKWHGRALSLQAVARAAGAAGSGADEAGAVRVGFTLTRKVGNAVIRNRARRRLKEALRCADDLRVVAGHDYVVVGRIDAVRLPFEALKSELAHAFIGVHDARRSKRGAAQADSAGIGAAAASKPRPDRTGPRGSG